MRSILFKDVDFIVQHLRATYRKNRAKFDKA